MQYKLIASLAISSSLAFGSLFGTSTQVAVPIIQEVSINTASSTQEIIEEKVTLNPSLLPVSKCESGGKHFNLDGTVIRGKVNPHDIGLMQINSDYHEASAKKMGLDIYSEEGNIRYANHLYETQGTAPWLASLRCWGN
jgi:hypothetical protein